MRILISCDYYLPGWKAGGQIRSLSGFINHLGDEIDFMVITRDRDWGEKRPYAGIKDGIWEKNGKAKVIYLSPKEQTFEFWLKLLRNVKHDLLYFTSYFSFNFTIRPLLLRKLGIIPQNAVVLSPNGELSRGSLSIKRYKKCPFNILAQGIGLYNNIYWVASSTNEIMDIRRIIQKRGGEIVIPPLINLNIPQAFNGKGCKNKELGTLKMVFMSRISREKNLKGALKMINGIRGKLFFDIFGPIKDNKYWRECNEIIKDLPKEIMVEYRGSVKPSDVVSILSNYELFFLPSLGESFGHVILESLIAGCPVLISDQTPWRSLQKEEVGWDISLKQEGEFRKIIQECIDMDEKTYQKFSIRAQEFGQRYIFNNRKEVIDQYRTVLNKFINGKT